MTKEGGHEDLAGQEELGRSHHVIGARLAGPRGIPGGNGLAAGRNVLGLYSADGGTGLAHLGTPLNPVTGPLTPPLPSEGSTWGWVKQSYR